MQENETKIHSNLQSEITLSEQQAEETKSKSLSDASKSDFITLKQIPEQERVEIIQTGFQRQAEGKISFRKYYEGTEEYSLFQLKGYKIKYESIRRTKLYKNLKE